MNKRIDDNLWDLTKEVNYTLSSIVNRNPLTQGDIKTIPFIDNYKSYVAVLYNNNSNCTETLLEFVDKLKPSFIPLITKLFTEYFDNKIFLIEFYNSIGGIDTDFTKIKSLCQNFNNNYLSNNEYRYYNKLDYDNSLSVSIPQGDGHYKIETDTNYKYYIELLKKYWHPEYFGPFDPEKFPIFDRSWIGDSPAPDPTHPIIFGLYLAYVECLNTYFPIITNSSTLSTFELNYKLGKIPNFGEYLQTFIDGYTTFSDYKILYNTESLYVGKTYFQTNINNILYRWRNYITNKDYLKVIPDILDTLDQLGVTDTILQLNNNLYTKLHPNESQLTD